MNKQTTTKTKTSAQISTCRKLTQTTGPNLGGQKQKERKNLTLKPGKTRPQTQYAKKKKLKEKHYTNEGINQKHKSPNK